MERKALLEPFVVGAEGCLKLGISLQLGGVGLADDVPIIAQLVDWAIHWMGS